MRLSRALVLLGVGPLVVRAHQGCNVETALNTLLGQATVGHVSEALLRSLQQDVKGAIERVEHMSPEQPADRVVDKYRVLRGLLLYMGIALPMI
ncbi:hypothetical protein LPJ61_007022 [Coemansia biformis]|uniref:Uncharacterized protein n=1 Tax=Coemansia biformis TaxID=1286918 RepID=A0A9W8CND1_9FUNG|nr:hypothetical protein LPJ61_007022 [Coemansia biformis]